MLLRDRLLARLEQMGDEPDYVRLAEEVLAIRNATPALARQLVAQALVIEDRQEAWTRLGARIAETAPTTPGVYVLRDAAGAPLYVGKALNLRRRLQTHFSSRRWRTIKKAFARAAEAEWLAVGSELEALLLEAQWIHELAPTVNTQVGAPSMTRPLPRHLIKDIVVLVPSVEADSVELVAARSSGPVMIQRTRRDGADLAVHVRRLWKFFYGLPNARRPPSEDRPRSPIVYSWLAGRGTASTRIEAADLISHHDLKSRLAAALDSPELFSERLILRESRLS